MGWRARILTEPGSLVGEHGNLHRQRRRPALYSRLARTRRARGLRGDPAKSAIHADAEGDAGRLEFNRRPQHALRTAAAGPANKLRRLWQSRSEQPS